MTQGRGSAIPTDPTIAWKRPVSKMPEKPADVKYDPARQALRVGDGELSGVRPEVWGYEVSGMQVVSKWTGYRTKKGAGRAASSKNPLDKIRMETWPDQWSIELRELITVLTRTVEMHPEQDALLDAICSGLMIPESELPTPEKWQHDEPKNTRSFAQGTLIA